MSKTWNSISIYEIIYEDKTEHHGNSGGWKDCYTFTATESYTIEYSLWTERQNNSWFMINKNWNTLVQYTGGGSASTGSFDVVANDVVNLKEYYNYAWCRFDISLKRLVVTLPKLISTHKSKPRQLKSIWEKATSTLFWYHIDNTRYNVETE